METKKTILLAITVVATLSVVFSSGMILPQENNAGKYNEGAMMLGHVTMVVYNPDGTVKKYYQGDNQITNQGENCIAELMFGVASSGATQCQGIAHTADEVFDTVAIGDSASPTPDEASLTLDQAQLRHAVTPTLTSSTGTASSKATAVLLATFTATNTKTFTESGVFDTTNTGNDNMLAHQSFTTGATLNNGDTIAVTWTIDIGPNGT